MHIDQQHALDAFAAYVRAYDPANPRISLKVAHTYRVAHLCARIASAQGPMNPGLAPSDANLAWLCGLLHDMGRFEQVRRFDTFNDAASVSHAELGAEVLFGSADPRGPQIGAYVNDRDEDRTLRAAIATHSDYRLPAGLDTRTRTFCDILRDADKIDIIKVNCTCPIEDIYGVTRRDMDQSELSPAVVETFYAHRTIPRGMRNHPADVLVGHICFAWELVYDESRRILREQGFIDQMLNRRFENPRTQDTFEAMADHMGRHLHAN